eukprot:TRINITY_DN2673_c0_g1_i1.p1 TRINITY_DN2673_c0_g1~~TRINITY_DN2673_c0_g1_i1.p1  ORF type:complete len:348 (+),score=85.15 TRINITY_DN2673_c0_g1_i1:1-1044(+)
MILGLTNSRRYLLLFVSFLILVIINLYRQSIMLKNKNEITEENKMKKNSMGREDDGDLEVPFYIYESEKLDNLRETCYQGITQKRSALQFIEQLKDHRWRTRDPEKAAVFIIPLAMMNYEEKFKYEVQYQCIPFGKLIGPIVEEIKSSKYFKRLDGRDHILVDPWWRAPTILDKLDLNIEFSSKVIFGLTGAKKPFSKSPFTISGLTRRCVVYVPFDNNYLQLGNKEINERQIDFFFLGEIDNLKPFRKNIFLNFPTVNGKISRLIDVGSLLEIEKCGFTETNSFYNKTLEFKRCKMERTNKFSEWTENSKFSLMLRGHDFQSERLFSAISFGTINLIFSDYIYETF